MKIFSINQDGSFNTEFYKLLSAGKIENIQPRFEFGADVTALEGDYLGNNQ